MKYSIQTTRWFLNTSKLLLKQALSIGTTDHKQKLIKGKKNNPSKPTDQVLSSLNASSNIYIQSFLVNVSTCVFSL